MKHRRHLTRRNTAIRRACVEWILEQRAQFRARKAGWLTLVQHTPAAIHAQFTASVAPNSAQECAA